MEGGPTRRPDGEGGRTERTGAPVRLVREGAEATTTRCARCGTDNRAQAKFCGNCAAPLVAAIACPGCGTENPPEQRFCDECGSPLRPSATPPPVPPAAADPAEGFGAGRYRTLRFLGEGGRKRVYLAEDTRLRRQVAVGTFKSDGLDLTALARARREAESMARLSDHPNVVAIYDIGEEGGRLYLVSEYVAGGDLEVVLAQADGHRLAIGEAVRIVTQVARGLERAHAEGVIHRDVKPSNIWMAPDGTAKLGDFGLAMSLDASRLTAEGAMVGTVAYMSPEQGLGRPVDARADLYALGAVLYETLCGVPPFTGEDTAAVISQHVSGTPVAPTWHRDDIPTALEQLVLRMLAKLPEDRPGSAAEVRSALEAIGAGTTVEGPREEDAEALERLTRGSFLGREAETRELRAAVDEALAGRGRVALVAGDEGIGKTRLAEEVATYANLRGATVLWGRAHDGEGAPAYWPWVQVIRAYVRAAAADAAADALRSDLGSGASDIAQIVSDVRAQLPDLPEPQAVDPEQARFRLFDSIAAFLVNASQRTPLAIVLDGLYRVDTPSVRLLEFLSRELASARIFVLGTYRDADVGPGQPVHELHTALRRERGYTHIRLGGLSEPEVAAMLEESAGHALESPAERGLVDVVYRESEGNPYFIQEILRHLVETGAIYQSGDRWISDIRRTEELGIPQGIADAVSRRLERLSAPCQEILEPASVIGREFALALLERVAGVEPVALMDLLQEAMDGGMVRAAPDEIGRYEFTHLATREALYGRLRGSRRVGLHRAVGEAIEELHRGRLDAHLGELAHHFALAAPSGLADKAVDYAWRAGERASRLYAYEESVAHYARAVALLPAGDDPARRCELLLALGAARSRTGDAEQAARSFLEAAGLAEEAGRPETFARAALGYGGGEVGFSVADRADERLVELLRQALELLPPEDGVLRVRVLARLAVELYYLDDPAEPDDVSREAVEMAERIGEAPVQLLAVHSRQLAIMSPDGLDERLAAGDEVVRLARADGDREMEFHGHHLRLTALLQRADLEQVDAEIRACTRLARALRQPRYDWQVTAFRAMRALLQGRFAEGDRLGHSALAIGQRGLGEMAATVFGVHVFLARWADDHLGEIEEGGRAFADTYRNSAWPAAFSMLLAESDKREETRARFDALKPEGFRAVCRNSNWLAAMACLSVVCLYLEDEQAGAVMHDLLAPYADQFVPILGGTSCMGSIHGWAGMVAHAAGRLDDAIEHYEQGIAANERVGARFIVPRLHYRMAQALKRRGGPGDNARAIREGEQGLELARAMGMVKEARWLLALRQYEAALAGVDVRTSIDLVARSVEEARPDLAPAAAPDGTVTIMFSDIEGSTVLTERLGDSGWFALLRLHNDIIREQLARHGGFEVRQLGDGFMIAFSSARMAIWCAVHIQRDLEAHRLRRPRDEIRVRIGLHTGETIRSNQDFFGTNVNMAARVADQARGDEIVVSSVLRDLVASGREFSFEDEREVELKGLTGRHRIFSVPWQEDESADAPESAPNT